MKNKKILTCAAAGLMLASLAGCNSSSNTSGGSSSSNEKTVTVSVYKGSFIDLLGEDKVNELYNQGFSLEDGEVEMLGDDLSSYTFTTYEGEEVQLPSEGPYIVEILGSWCQYCQRLTSETLDTALSSGIKVYQYFLSAENSDIDDFYSTIEKDIPDGVTVLRNSQEFENYISEKELYSVPMSIVVNSEGKVALTHIGYVDSDTFMSFYDYAKDLKLYDIDVNGVDLKTYLAQQVIIKNYIANLDEIDIPESVLNGETVSENSSSDEAE